MSPAAGPCSGAEGAYGVAWALGPAPDGPGGKGTRGPGELATLILPASAWGTTAACWPGDWP